MANDNHIIRAAMSILGKRTSKRKAESSRRNGKLAWSKKRKLTDSKKAAK